MRCTFCAWRLVFGGTEWRRLALGKPASDDAYTLIEVLFVVSFGVLVGAVATPQLTAAADDVRAAGAVRYIATRLQQARIEAVSRSVDVGWQFVATPTGYQFAPYADGNGNGIRTHDIQQGIDARIAAVDRLTDRFAGVEFGALAGLPPVDPGGTVPGTDPIRVGSSNILTFTVLGTSSSGSLYVLGRQSRQYAIRIYGETGKVRVLKFDVRTRRWIPA